MPHTKSARKNLRKSDKRRRQNRAVMRTIKETIRDFQEALSAGDPAKLKDAYRVVAKKLDKAAAKRVVHPNLAARKKSQLARLMNQKTQPTPPPAKG